MLTQLRDRYLRIDARSLGLFRIAFALVLLGDLFRRWSVLDAFYSNDGVLPNHNHLFNLGEDRRVWSLLHAFSHASDAAFAFILFFLVYVFFLLGWKTRAFHALALVALVSLTGRNLLLENAGNYAAIALCLLTLFLPLGRRFSLDAVVASMRARREHNAAELNDRTDEEPDYGAVHAGSAERAPGASPTSIAALAVILQLSIIYMSSAYQQSGELWKSGWAIGYALQSPRWVSPLGLSLRAYLPDGVLNGLVRYAQLALPVLLLVPIARRFFRGVSAVLMVLHGLVFGLLFAVGLYGWTLVAAAALVIPTETWEARRARSAKRSPLTVVYDADCGICLWIARLLARLDLDRRLHFRSNNDLGPPAEAPPSDAMATGDRPLPAEVTPALAADTVVVVGPRGRVYTKTRAVSAVLMALPLGLLPGLVLRVPGITQLADVFYDVFAKRRMRVSEACGLGVCGVPSLEATDAEAPPVTAPSTIFRRRVSGSVRELLAVMVLASLLGQTAKENPIGWMKAFPQPALLESVAIWPRMIGRWDMMAPDPGTSVGSLVVDALTKGGGAVDPMTGEEPAYDVVHRAPLGQLWADYLERIHQKDYVAYQRAFKDYLAKGRPAYERTPPEEKLTGFDAYWVTQSLPGAGGGPAGDPSQEKLFSHSRGGRAPGQRIPMLGSGTLKIEKKD